MTGWPRAAEGTGASERAGIAHALARWGAQHARPGPDGAPGADDADAGIPPAFAVLDMEVLRPGRPGLLDVVAEAGGELAHAVLGLRRPDDELHLVGPVEEPALGVLEDADGLAVVVDALHDADCAQALLDVVAGEGVRGRPRAVVTALHDATDAVTLGFDGRFTFTVFPWLHRGPHPGVALLAGLDDAGFNHLPAPIAFWRRAGRDLGVVQELVSGSADGWAVALTSLRDVLAAGVAPDEAGGDFAPESFALGTMAARMHLALERAFGRRDDDVARWVDPLVGDLGASPRADLPGDLGASPRADLPGDLAADLRTIRASGLRVASIRTHGDFHLGRTARTDHGWVLADCMPGGVDASSGVPVVRPALADVADFGWSLRHAAGIAASEQSPAADATRTAELAGSWAARNRRAFLAAYLAVPGIDRLVPTDRRVVRLLIAAFEAARVGDRPVARGATG